MQKCYEGPKRNEDEEARAMKSCLGSLDIGTPLSIGSQPSRQFVRWCLLGLGIGASSGRGCPSKDSPSTIVMPRSSAGGDFSGRTICVDFFG